MRMIRKALIILPLLTISATAFAQQPKPEPSTEPKTQAELSEPEIRQRFGKILDAKLDNESTYLTVGASRMLGAMIRQGAKELVDTKKTDQLPEAEKNLNFFLDKLLVRANHSADGIRITTRDVERLLESDLAQSTKPFSGLCPLFPFCKIRKANRMDALSGFNSANELAKQLITLSTGILALSITFIKDILKGDSNSVRWTLVVAWSAYFCCIVFGIWTMMAVTGSIFKAASDPNPSAMYGPNIQIPAGLQILSFLIATIFLIIYGAMVLLRPRPIVGAAVTVPGSEATPDRP